MFHNYVGHISIICVINNLNPEIHLYTNYFFILAEHFPLALIWIGAVTAAPAAVPPLTAEGGRTPATVLSLGAGYPARFLIR